jgi:hypothetical protein
MREDRMEKRADEKAVVQELKAAWGKWPFSVGEDLEGRVFLLINNEEGVCIYSKKSEQVGVFYENLEIKNFKTFNGQIIIGQAYHELATEPILIGRNGELLTMPSKKWGRLPDGVFTEEDFIEKINNLFGNETIPFEKTKKGKIVWKRFRNGLKNKPVLLRLAESLKKDFSVEEVIKIINTISLESPSDLKKLLDYEYEM